MTAAHVTRLDTRRTKIGGANAIALAGELDLASVLDTFVVYGSREAATAALVPADD